MIREATKQDLNDILNIYNDAIINTTTVYSYEKTNLEERMKWFENKTKNNWPVIVYEIDGEVAGFATYGAFRDWPAYQYTIEHSIYVDEKYRRRGIASQLLEKIISLARESGYKTLIGGIDADNKGSIILHERHGFQFVGKLNKIGYKFDRWLDLSFYQLILE